MAAIKWFLGLLILVAITQLGSCNKIKILSDFTIFQDKEFFKTTFPWIAQNIGSKLRVKYYLKDERDGGKRMCVLDNLRRNLLLQADYMKCEANGEKDCLKNLPLDQRKLDKCMRKSHKKLRSTERQFRKYRPSETPVIIRGRSQQSVLDPKTVLFNICGMFGRNQPEGCRKPSEAPVPATPSTTECTQPSTQLPTESSTDPGTTEKPTEVTTQQPSKATTIQPSEATTEELSQTTTEQLSQATTEQSSQTTTQKSSQTTTEQQSQTSREVQSQSTAEPPRDTNTTQASDATAVQPKETTTILPSETTIKESSQTTIEQQSQSTTKQP
ncbi:mucin-2-like, partial [Cydia pomonella]|uniref:mucin-2-like n=1 Tax=Cydia pomonella TaxID=82600 RepID=UPI002ADDA819